MVLSHRGTLMLLGVIFHVVYIWSIFDIYFRSPLVHGMTPHRADLPSPARRLVLFVGDGLRADKLYEPYRNESLALGDESAAPETEYLAPFLHNIIRTQGSWGVSHTRVPTESRPGHVALIAGFYEDVSAVTKGWKMNPVNFDSTFNQSRHTWSFGSPDILPMFSHGATNPEHVETFMYTHESEDFSADGSQLDTWVFERVQGLFDRAESNQTLREQLHQPQIVFFLHLLGLDTNGHAHRPHSNEYLNNIRSVDQGIEAIVNRVQDFYADDRTAFVFTADHGMNNRGSHGDGHPDNTRTPIIAWGAGVRGPERQPAPAAGHDAFSVPWGFSDLVRRDIEQADIAPLMTSLIGVPFPLNSVGVLPLGYLENEPEYKARSALANAHQILAQYEVKCESKRAHQLFFKPYPQLNQPDQRPDQLIQRIELLIEHAQYTEAETLCLRLIDLSLDGLRYYQTYDWVFLQSVVTAGYLGWILYSTLFILQHYVLGSATASPHSRIPPLDTSALVFTHLLNTFALLILGGLYTLLYVQKSPLMYYAYVAFPVYFWCEVIKTHRVFGSALHSALTFSPPSVGAGKGLGSGGGNPWWWVGGILLYILVLELLVVSYFHRSVLSGLFVLLALWPHVVDSALLTTRFQTRVPYLWTLFCLLMSVFTLLPVEKGEDQWQILAGGALICASGIVALGYRHTIMNKTKSSGGTGSRSRSHSTTLATAVLAGQTALVGLTCVLVLSTIRSLTAKAGLPEVNQLLAWAVLASPIIPLGIALGTIQTHLHRLVTIYLALAPPFILLSISYEVLFYFCLGVTLLLAVYLEQYRELAEPRQATLTYKGNHYTRLGLGDLFTAGQFLFLVNVGFFGTGNVASISSFSLEAVYRLTTIFDPFLMGALLIFKILIPFFLLSTVLGVINRIKRLPPMAMFLLVLATTDIMTLNFFYLVKDTGSWLEIGTTISHFCIASLFVLFVMALYLVSQLFTNGIRIPPLQLAVTKKNR
ncbi:GPI ethanolamine phosphate transferase [Dimargaris cristalligena]|uniref:GPI ethanolamine phosphate transferase 1 n=1 Tax=Dimargaris cristalligena TaxID=215637 RepID=A0A4P9ZUC9_9FUNG|nr:GPI ethanolamine phosphate transferase [Dimargaris cristalligena]|eukprot:RKP36392.1 GPI ethanolamine phosphate transferase [Dimargaris cristalligena]